MKELDHLIKGYHHFRDNDWPAEKERWEELRTGQAPEVLIIACSDSRVEPTRIFNCRPGEIFAVRNVAALVPPFEKAPGYHGVSAAVEYAVTQLKVKAIFIMGHGSCGGCQASLHRIFDDARLGEGGFIDHWVDMLDEARDKVLKSHKADSDEAKLAMEYEAVKISMRNLRTFGFVSQAEQSGQLSIYGGHYAIAHGQLTVLNETTGEFEAPEAP